MLKRKGLIAKLLSRSSFCCLCLLLTLPVVLRAQQDLTETATSPDALPAEARYLILFRRLTSPQSQNQTSEQPEPRVARPNYRVMFQRNANLSDEEARALNQIADDCLQRVKELDKRAREISAAYRTENRSRNVAPGDPLPPPPAELSQLQQDRNNVILAAVEQIRIAFGDTEFKRLDEYVKNKGNGKVFVLPSANKQPLPIQVTITLFGRDGTTPRKQFAADEKVIVRVAMLNNSTQMIAVKEPEVYDWLQILSADSRELPLIPRVVYSGPNSGKEPAVDVPPTQLTIVARIELGPGVLKLKPGEYHIVLHDKVLLNRPPNDSEVLELSFSGSERVMFEIVP
jgi:hypothetical protein